MRTVSRWLGLESIVRLFVVRPTLRLADALARFDDRVLDRAITRATDTVLALSGHAARLDDQYLDRGVELTSTATLRTAGRAARADDHWLDGSVEWFAAQMRRLGQLARWPQTGQLHQYALQAVVLVVVGVLLLVALR